MHVCGYGVSAERTAVITLLIALLFFIPQQLKATDHRFEKRLKWERAFIFSSPVLFLVLMVPFAHAWTVHHRQSLILDDFNQIVSSASEMFDQYESYSKIREISYDQVLQARNSGDSVTNRNKMEVLHLILLSSNYDTLKSVSKVWMDKATDKRVTTWNVFLLGNLTGIYDAVSQWYGDLQTFSETKLSDERDVKKFDSNQRFFFEMENIFSNTAAHYTDIKGFSPLTPLWLLIVYAMLLFPYLLQSRHTKTTGTKLTLFGARNQRKIKEPASINEVPEKIEDANDTKVDFPKTGKPEQKSDHDAFESFKM